MTVGGLLESVLVIAGFCRNWRVSLTVLLGSSYLSDSKKLILPALLGINPADPTQTLGPHVELLVSRYWKLATVPFDTMREWVVLRWDICHGLISFLIL